MSDPLSVSIVVPAGPERTHLARCLASVAELRPRADEVVLVLDGQGPGSAPSGGPEGLRVISTATATGPAAARNAGARTARGDVLLFLDADVTVPPDLVGRVRETLGADPSLAAAFGSYDDAPADRSFVSRYRNLVHHFVHQASRRSARTFWGACGAVRRDVFLGAGGFDEGYRRASVEDIELGYRLTEAGHAIRLDPALQVKHWKRWTFTRMVATDVLRRGVPWSLLLLRRGRAESDLNLRWRDRAAVVAVWAGLGAAVLAGRPDLALLSLAAATAADAPLLTWMARKAGAGFALRAIPLRWLFHLYAGLSFGLAVPLHLATRFGAGRSGPTAPPEEAAAGVRGLPPTAPRPSPTVLP